MKRCLNIASAFALVMLVAACGTWANTDQTSAGITKATVDVCHDQETGAAFPCRAEIIDGKDKQNVALKIASPNGWSVDYSADKSTAVDALAVRAEVDKAISSDLKEAVPGIVDNVTSAILRAFGASP